MWQRQQPMCVWDKRSVRQVRMPPWTSQALAFLLGDKDALLVASPVSVAAPEAAGEVVASLMPPTGTGDGEVGLAVDILGTVSLGARDGRGWLPFTQAGRRRRGRGKHARPVCGGVVCV